MLNVENYGIDHIPYSTVLLVVNILLYVTLFQHVQHLQDRSTLKVDVADRALGAEDPTMQRINHPDLRHLLQPTICMSGCIGTSTSAALIKPRGPSDVWQPTAGQFLAKSCSPNIIPTAMEKLTTTAGLSSWELWLTSHTFWRPLHDDRV